MRKTLHVCLDLRGAIRNFQASKWKRVVTDDSGRYLSPDEVKEFFLDELASGKRVIPYGKACDGFDFQKGCPGHPIDEKGGGGE